MGDLASINKHTEDTPLSQIQIHDPFVHVQFSEIDHMLGHNLHNLSSHTVIKIEIFIKIFTDHNSMKEESKH